MAHKSARNDLTANDVRKLLYYDMETGILRWRVNSGSKVVGARADYKHDNTGRTRVRLFGKPYFSHRICWLFVTGRWPREEIDHIDGNPANNSWNNLREATSSQNICNSRMYSNNKSGHRGVFFDKTRNKWRAEIRYQHVKKPLGRFATKEEAIKAYKLAAAELHKNFSGLHHQNNLP